MAIEASSTRAPRDVVRPGDLGTTWLIARRGALESLRDQMTVSMSAVFSLAVPLIIVLLVIRPMAQQTGAGGARVLGGLIASYLLVVGLMPSSGSIGIAAGMFAGEKEHGSLLPLLASPASNRAIFAGKVLGAVLPAMLFAAVAVIGYLAEIWLLLGGSTLRLLPLPLSAALVALVPANAVLGAAVASLVSSRVRTYQNAQMISGLAVVPVMGGLFSLSIQMQRWGPGSLAIAVGGLVAIGLLLIVVSAATWQREEVMARR
jgi:ABC-type transport system involved in multi-copper enzyme maturation permease subunit